MDLLVVVWIERAIPCVIDFNLLRLGNRDYTDLAAALIFRNFASTISCVR